MKPATSTNITAASWARWSKLGRSLLGQDLGQQRRLIARKIVALVLQLAGDAASAARCGRRWSRTPPAPKQGHRWSRRAKDRNTRRRAGGRQRSESTARAKLPSRRRASACSPQGRQARPAARQCSSRFPGWSDRAAGTGLRRDFAAAVARASTPGNCGPNGEVNGSPEASAVEPMKTPRSGKLSAGTLPSTTSTSENVGKVPCAAVVIEGDSVVGRDRNHRASPSWTLSPTTSRISERGTSRSRRTASSDMAGR